ncbi:hypothetical protein Tco_1007564, partial [Tanacetum coccineum]
PQEKKRKQSAGESSLPRQLHKITIQKKKQHTTLILPPSDDRERDEIAEATLLSLTLHKTTLAAEAQENIAKVQEKLLEDEIEKLVEGDEDEEWYASEFVDFMLNNDVDDFDTKLESESHKENPKKIDDDDNDVEKNKTDDIDIEKVKNNKTKIEQSDDNVVQSDEVVKEKEVVNDEMGSKEIRKEQKQTSIPSPSRPPKNVTSSDKTVSEALIANVSPTTATTSKVSSTRKHKKKSIYIISKTLPGSIAGMCSRCGLIRSHVKHKFVTHDFFMSNIRETLDHCNKVVPDVTFAKTKEMITQEIC